MLSFVEKFWIRLTLCDFFTWSTVVKY
jgi:hypothetical protein